MAFDDKKAFAAPPRKPDTRTPLQKMGREMWTSLLRVVWMVMGIYFWLVWFYPT